MVIEIIKKEGNIIKFSIDGDIFTLTALDGEIKIDCQDSGSTVFCWKGPDFNESINLEDVVLHFRKGQSIKKFYELDELLEESIKENAEEAPER